MGFAQYARRGFFELVTASALVVPLLLVGQWALNHDDEVSVRRFHLLAFALLLLVDLVAVSAWWRMRLYTSAYGLTADRFYATAFIIWIGIILGWFAVTIRRERPEQFAFGAIVSGFALLALLNAMNPDALIARVNLSRADAGKELDVSYLSHLSADAAPTIIDSWERLDSGTGKSIYDISFADEKNGWAVGRRGLILHTLDGGETWSRQKSPRFPVRHLFAVHAVSRDLAWTVGDWGSRYVTRDGGATWEDASMLMDESHPAFQYLSEEDLEAFHAGEKVYDDTYLNDLFFLDEQRGWIAAEYGIIFYTQDGGATWEKGSIIGKDAFEPVEFAAGEEKVARAQWSALFTAAERLNDKQHLRVRLEGFLTEAELRAKNGETPLADDRANAVRDFPVVRDRLPAVSLTHT